MRLRSVAVPWLVLGLGAFSSGWAGDDGELAKLPLESEGDLHFFVDVSGYRGSAGETDQEIYVSITNDQLVYEPREDVFAGRLRLAILARDASGRELFSKESELRPQAASELDAEDRGILQIIRENAPLPPGRLHLEVKIVDEKAQKTGLLNRMRNAKKDGTASGWIDVRDFGNSGFGLSDLTLVRKVRAAETDDVFGRHGVDFDPNPSRFYGIAMPSVRCYLEVYGDEPPADGASFLVRTRVLDRGEVPLLERTTRTRPRSASFVITDGIGLPPSQVPAGSYFLDVGVLDESTGETATARKLFEVIWSVTSWSQDPEALLQEMELVMSHSEFETLGKLTTGAREIYLAEFWRELDPDPDTPENEALFEFRRRVNYANRQFAATLERGVLTDRGRVFVRYGPPDEVNYQYSSSSFGLDGGSERVAGPGERARIGNRPSASFLDREEFQEGDLSDVADQRGGANIKAKSLEVWTYDGPGRSLTHRRDLDSQSHRGLKFIFADEMGNGDYELIGSTGATIY